MKKSDFVVFAVFDFVYLLTACLLAKLLADLSVKFADVLTPISYFVGAIIQIVVLGCVSVALLFVVAYRDGYRYANIDLKVSLLSAGIASLVHFAIGLATRFTPILTGPTRHITGIVTMGEHYDSLERVEQISFGTMTAVGVLMLLVYVATIVLACQIGCRKRLRDRAETTSRQSASI